MEGKSRKALIRNQNDIPGYMPPGHEGTVNVRLIYTTSAARGNPGGRRGAVNPVMKRRRGLVGPTAHGKSPASRRGGRGSGRLFPDR